MLPHGGALGDLGEIGHEVDHFRAVIRRGLADDAGAHAMHNLPLQGVDRVLLGLEFRIVGRCADQTGQVSARRGRALGFAAVRVAGGAGHEMAAEGVGRHPGLLGAEGVVGENLRALRCGLVDRRDFGRGGELARRCGRGKGRAC